VAQIARRAEYGSVQAFGRVFRQTYGLPPAQYRQHAKASLALVQLGALVLWLVAGSEPKVLLARTDIALAAILSVATGIGSAWIATILWNIASQRLSASLCGQLIVSETIFALIYSFVWDGQWPSAAQFIATALFVAGILASIRAHR
jgi:drug/metabolite transporter (DMT)-like permease